MLIFVRLAMKHENLIISINLISILFSMLFSRLFIQVDLKIYWLQVSFLRIPFLNLSFEYSGELISLNGLFQNIYLRLAKEQNQSLSLSFLFSFSFSFLIYFLFENFAILPWEYHSASDWQIIMNILMWHVHHLLQYFFWSWGANLVIYRQNS